LQTRFNPGAKEGGENRGQTSPLMCRPAHVYGGGETRVGLQSWGEGKKFGKEEKKRTVRGSVPLSHDQREFKGDSVRQGRCRGGGERVSGKGGVLFGNVHVRQ